MTDNVAVPPAGGCVVSAMVKLDITPDLLSYPGFRPRFFHGDFKRGLRACAQLFNVRPVAV